MIMIQPFLNLQEHYFVILAYNFIGQALKRSAGRSLQTFPC